MTWRGIQTELQCWCLLHSLILQWLLQQSDKRLILSLSRSLHKHTSSSSQHFLYSVFFKGYFFIFQSTFTLKCKLLVQWVDLRHLKTTGVGQHFFCYCSFSTKKKMENHFFKLPLTMLHSKNELESLKDSNQLLYPKHINFLTFQKTYSCSWK